MNHWILPYGELKANKIYCSRRKSCLHIFFKIMLNCFNAPIQHTNSWFCAKAVRLLLVFMPRISKKWMYCYCCIFLNSTISFCVDAVLFICSQHNFVIWNLSKSFLYATYVGTICSLKVPMYLVTHIENWLLFLYVVKTTRKRQIAVCARIKISPNKQLRLHENKTIRD